MGFEVDILTEANEAADGIVIRVEGAGTEVESGSTVTIYVSTGPESSEVPSEDAGNTEDSSNTEDTGNTEGGSEDAGTDSVPDSENSEVTGIE